MGIFTPKITRRKDKGTGLTTTTYRKPNTAKTSTTRSFVSSGTRYSTNLNTGKIKKTKLW